MNSFTIVLYSDIVNCSKSSQRALEELQRTITELEAKYKSEISRLKKKYETDIREFEIQIDVLNRNNAELAKANKSLSNRVKVLCFPSIFRVLQSHVSSKKTN